MKNLLLLSCLFLVSCHLGNKGKAGNMINAESSINVDSVLFPAEGEILHLKSYYLSASYQQGASTLVYGYNYKNHNIDCIDLSSLQMSQIPLSEEGADAILRPLGGVTVLSPDSIWIYDASQRALLIDHRGKVMASCNLRKGLDGTEDILVNTNYAMCTAKLHYDAARHSLLYGVKDYSTTPASFKVREISLKDASLLKEYPLKPSIAIPDVAGGEYANMGEVNISFTKDKIIYNYPAESHIYVMSRNDLQVKAVEADSRFTKNKAEKCSSRNDYSQWERHGIENPHFYDVMHLPTAKMYARIHIGGINFDASQPLADLINNRDFYLMLFDEDLVKLGEFKLTSKRYSPFTGWCALKDGVAFYADNAMDATITERLAIDIISCMHC